MVVKIMDLSILRCAQDPTSACEAAIALLASAGLPLLSVYLESGGRLRCHGLHGYGQMFDGIRPGTGVIGRAHATGEEQRVVADERLGYRPAALNVQQELAVPLLYGGARLGVLNVETPTVLTAADETLTRQVGAVLAERLGALGTPPLSRSQQLVECASQLADAADAEELGHVLQGAALRLSGLSSAAVVLVRPLRVVAAAGPAQEGLRAWRHEELQHLLPWVSSGVSSRSSEDAGSTTAPVTSVAQALLLAASLQSFALVPLLAGTELLAVLVVGAVERGRATTVMVETLELLASLAAAHLRTLRATTALRAKARTDHLTGLPHRRAFDEDLAAAVRDADDDDGFGLVAIDVDGFKEVNDRQGHAAGDRLLDLAARLLASVLRGGEQLYRTGGDEFAVIATGAGGEQGVQALGERLNAAARSSGFSVSCGAAVRRPGELPEDLAAAADVALYAAKQAGKDRTRSRST